MMRVWKGGKELLTIYDHVNYHMLQRSSENSFATAQRLHGLIDLSRQEVRKHDEKCDEQHKSRVADALAASIATCSPDTIHVYLHSSIIDTIVKLLVIYRASPRICANACELLQHICSHASDDKMRENLQLLSGTHISSAILQGLSEHGKKDVTVTMQGILALKGLIQQNNTHCKALSPANAFQLIVQILHCHSNFASGDFTVCATICDFIAYTSDIADGYTCRTLFGLAGACEAVTRVITSFLTSPLACQNACSAIRNLSDGGGVNTAKLCQSGACDAVVRAFITHASDTWTSQQICWTIGVMSSDDTMRSFLGLCGACEAIVQSLVTYTHRAGICKQACEVVGNLCARHIDNQVTQCDLHTQKYKKTQKT